MADHYNLLIFDSLGENLKLVEGELKKLRIDFTVNHVKAMSDFEIEVRESSYDLIISDTGTNNYTALDALRFKNENSPDIPFIILSDTLNNNELIDLINEGAYNYVLKENSERLNPIISNALSCKQEKEKFKSVKSFFEASNKKYLDLYENAPDMYLTIDMKSAIIKECNHTLSKNTGYSKAEIIGHSVYEFYDSRNSNQIRNDIIPLLLQYGKVENAELSIYKKDKSILHGMINIDAKYGKDNLIHSVRAVIRDVSKIVEEQHEKEIIEKKYQSLFESSADAIYIHPYIKDGYGKFSDVNKFACKMLGYTKEELLNLSVLDITVIGFEDYRGKFNREEFEEKKEMVFETMHITKDGRLIPVEISSKIFEVENKVLVISTARDISLRKEQEKELEESEKRYRLALDAAEEGVWDWRTDSDIVYYSDHWKAQVGYLPNELPNKFLTWNDLLHPEDKERMNNEVQQYLKNPKKHFIAQFRLRHKDGSYRWIKNKAASELDEDGNVIRMFGAHTDITDQYISEVNLRKEKDKFEALYEEYLTQNENLHETIKMLASSRKNLRNKIEIINRSPIVTFSWESVEGWPVKFVSENVENIFGYSSEDFISGKLKYKDVVHPDDLERIKEESDESIRKGNNKIAHKSYRIITKNKDVKWVNDDTIIVKENGKLTKYEGIITDVTGRIKVQQALKLSESKYRRMLDANNDMIIITNTHFKVEYLNPAAKEYFGNLRSNVKCFDLLYGYDSQCDWCKHSELNFKELNQQEIVNPKDGKRFIISFSKLKNADGTYSYMTSYKDVTEIRNIQNERLKLLETLEAGLNEIYIFDSETLLFQYVNKRVYKNLGYTEEELFKMTHIDLIPEFNKSLYKKLLLPLKSKNKKTIQLESFHKRKDETLYPVEIKLQLIEQEGERTILAVVNDITEKVEKDETIRILSAAIEQSPVAVYITDTNGKIEFVNPVVEKVTGYTREELIGKTMEMFYSGEHDKSFNSDMYKAISEGNVWRGEFHNKKKNGEFFWEESRISPVRNSVGNITHYISLNEDITHRKEIEKRLIESEQHFRVLFERSLIGMYLTTPEGKILKANEALYKMLGFNSFEELSKVNLEHNENYVTNREEFKKLIDKDDYVVGFESVWLNRMKKPIYVRESARRFVNAEGQVFYEGTVENITDWKLADVALKEMHNFNEQIIKVGNLGYATYSETGDCLSLNDSYAEIVGATKNQILSQNFNEISNWKKTGLLNSAKRCLEEGIQVKNIIDSESSFKKRVWIEIFLSRLIVEDQKNLLVIIKDISSIIRAKKRQLQTRAEYVGLIENVNNPVFGIDKNGNVNEWNATMEDLSGYLKNEIKGKGLETIIYGKETNKSANFVKDFLTGFDLSNIEFKLLTKDNNKKKLLISSSIRKSLDGKSDGVIFVGQDITEIDKYKTNLEKQVQERTHKLIEALKKEKELGDLKSQFVSMASHEFRTPLAAISFAAGFIKKYWERIDDDGRIQKLNKIETQVKHMTNLLDDVLDFGRTEAKKIPFNPRKINITEFLILLIEEVQNIDKRTHEIRFKYDQKNSYIMIDEKVARNIFTNLLVNAVKFSPDAKYVDLGLKTNENNVIIEVTDYGIGIRKEELDHVFTPFHRGKNVKTIQGTGLGLAIVKESIDLLKGGIEVKSIVGEGTSFIVNLPKIIEKK